MTTEDLEAQGAQTGLVVEYKGRPAPTKIPGQPNPDRHRPTDRPLQPVHAGGDRDHRSVQGHV